MDQSVGQVVSQAISGPVIRLHLSQNYFYCETWLLDLSQQKRWRRLHTPNRCTWCRFGTLFSLHPAGRQSLRLAGHRDTATRSGCPHFSSYLFRYYRPRVLWCRCTLAQTDRTNRVHTSAHLLVCVPAYGPRGNGSNRSRQQWQRPIWRPRLEPKHHMRPQAHKCGAYACTDVRKARTHTHTPKQKGKCERTNRAVYALLELISYSKVAQSQWRLRG